MIQIRPAAERGHVQQSWLESDHTFSFAAYHDPRHMGFRSLRVINEDRVQPGRGFASHAHQDMEIISYVLEGELAHRDSLGNGSVIRPGDVQLMRAGSGITHSEHNPSAEAVVHFLQIWLLPERPGLPPAYQQQHFPDAARRQGLLLVASPDGRAGSLQIQQDVFLYAASLAAGQSVSHRLATGRHAWLQVARGRLQLNGLGLQAGDGAAVSDEATLAVVAENPAEILLFDLA